MSNMLATARRDFLGRAVEFCQSLNRKTIDLVDDFYAADATFIDPAGKLEGRDRIRQYLTKTYRDIDSVSFTFDLTLQSQTTVVLSWTMRFSHRRLRHGDEIECHGTSIFQFDPDGHVVHQRDYYDLGEMVYEHLPLLGWPIRKIRQSMEVK